MCGTDRRRFKMMMERSQQNSHPRPLALISSDYYSSQCRSSIHCPSSLSFLFLDHLLHPGISSPGPQCCPPSSIGARSRNSLSSTLLLGAHHLLRPWRSSQIRRTPGRANGSPPPRLQPRRQQIFVLPPFAGKVPPKFTLISPLLRARMTGSHKIFLFPGTTATPPSNPSHRTALRLRTTMLWLLVLNK